MRTQETLITLDTRHRTKTNKAKKTKQSGKSLVGDRNNKKI